MSTRRASCGPVTGLITGRSAAAPCCGLHSEMLPCEREKRRSVRRNDLENFR